MYIVTWTIVLKVWKTKTKNNQTKITIYGDGQFIGGENHSTQQNDLPATSQGQTFLMLYRVDLAMIWIRIVNVYVDHTGSCKSNYHMIITPN